MDNLTVKLFCLLYRCPEYFNVPPNCPYVTDPNDPTCCKVPQCTPTAPPGMTPVIPTIPPGTFVGQPNNTQFVGEYINTLILTMLNQVMSPY